MLLYSFQDPRHSLLHLPLFPVRRRRLHPQGESSFVLVSVSVGLLTNSRSTLSASPPATEYDEHDPYDPNYYISSDNNGLYNMYTAETVVPQMQAVRMACVLCHV